METAIKEVEILEQIHSSQSPVRQRALAEIAGLSLGMTNAIVKRLAEKGWITVRKVNGRNLAYAVTPEGMEVIASRSYKYLKRTIKSVVLYRRKLEEFAKTVKKAGYTSVCLAGESDLDFIVEHSCGKSGLAFQAYKDRKAAQLQADAGTLSEATFLLFGEDVPPEGDAEASAGGSGRGYLQQILHGVRV